MVMATMADSHREWHRNAGVPMGTPGCPQDACHPIVDDYDGNPDTLALAVRCGNRKAHGTEVVHHLNAEAVRRCHDLTRRSEAGQ